ncbi:MAG: (2Fe-2S)-binding protein, partial [Burkholderiales bacterium]
MTIQLDVNGQRHAVSAAEETPLLYVLRNDLRLKGARFG